MLEELYFTTAIAEENEETYKQFIKKFPAGKHINEVKIALEKIHWAAALSKYTTAAFEEFINTYPNSLHRPEADTALINIEEKEYQEVIASNSIEKLVKFKEKYPKSKYTISVDNKLKDLKALFLPFLGADRKYRLYDISANQFKSITAYDEFRFLKTNHLWLKSDTLCGIFDTKGNQVIPVAFPCINNTSKDQYIVFNKGKYGLYSINGTKIIDPIYNEIYDWTDLPYYQIQKGWGKNAKYGIIDTSGKVIVSPIYSSMNPAFMNNSGFLITKLAGLEQLIKITGEKIGKPFKTIFSLDSMYLVTSDGSKYGIMDIYGKELVPLKYKEIRGGNFGEFIVKNSIDEYSIINESGKILFPFQPVYYVDHLANDLYLIQASESEGYMIYSSSKESFISGKESYRNVTVLEENRYLAEIGYSVKVYNQNWESLKTYNNVISQETIDAYYASVDDEYFEGEGYGHDDYYEEEYYYGCYSSTTEHIDLLTSYNSKEIPSSLKTIMIDNKYGYYDQELNLRIPCKYQTAYEFINGLATVATSDENMKYHYQIINENGAVVLKDYQIVGWSSSNPSLFLMAKTYNSQYAWYNKSTGELTPMDPYFTYYKMYNAFNLYTYKDAMIFETNTGERLMDPNINFNDYYATQLSNEGWDLKINSNYNGAINKYKEALKFTPRNSTLYGNIADCYMSLGYNNEALEYLNQGIDYSYDTWLIGKRAELYGKLNQNSNAAYDYISLAEAAIRDKSDKSTIANYYFKAGYEFTNSYQYDDAISTISKGFKYDQSSSAAWAYNNRGVAHGKLGDYQLALNDYEIAIDKCSGCSDESMGLYLHNAAIQLYNLNRKYEACIYYKRAMNKNSKYTNDYYN